MEVEEIQRKLVEALNKLLEVDSHLFIENLSEQSITHRLALHLTPKFLPAYRVDCDYNGNVESETRRKEVSFLIEEALKLGIIKEEDKTEEDIITRRVFPDIIVHERGNNRHNLLVIEAKKSTNRRQNATEYDFQKLKKFTSPIFNYDVGAFVEFIVGNAPNWEIRWFENGFEVNL